jgi:hypothetical protein
MKMFVETDQGKADSKRKGNEACLAGRHRRNDAKEFYECSKATRVKPLGLQRCS